jgi:hypothetical protein
MITISLVLLLTHRTSNKNQYPKVFPLFQPNPVRSPTPAKQTRSHSFGSAAKHRIVSTFSSSKSDRQPKPNECDCFLAIQLKIGTHSSHLIQRKSIASPNYFAIGFSNVNPTYPTHSLCISGRRCMSNVKIAECSLPLHVAYGG